MKKVIVVGAGVAGLSAGIYALQSGFDVTILEMHKIPGGNCTSWRRKGYLFEGGLHWLTGSDDGQPINKVWRNLGAIDENTKVFRRDPFFVYEQGGKKAFLYSEPQDLQKHLLNLSPRDKRVILSLVRDIKRFAKMSMPILDSKGVRVREKSTMTALMFLRMLPAILRIPKIGKMLVADYVNRFESPLIRGLLENIVGKNFTATSMFFTLGTLAAGDGGYLAGGSLKMAANMAKRFTSLGGTIHYSTKVQKILTQENKAIGVQIDGEQIMADAVIVTADTRHAIDTLFEQPLLEPWAEAMRSQTVPMVCTFISIGVQADLSDLAESITFALEKPLNYAGIEYEVLGFRNYANYEGYAPKGCSAMTAILMGDTYEYWKMQKETGNYTREKEKVAEQIIGLLEKYVPQTRGKVDVVDVATPLTYERYCGTYHGSWMTVVGVDDAMIIYPAYSTTFQNLYFAGQRMQPPGGLPIAADSGRRAVQHLCKDMDVVFLG